MNAADFIAAIDLPAGVCERMPKKPLTENGAPTTADKYIIMNNDVEELL